MLPSQDTIIAQSSPPGSAGRALIRISGPASFSMVQSWLQGTPPEERRLAVCRLKPEVVGLAATGQERGAASGFPILAAFFKGPHSFTGEDTVELQPVGQPDLVERLIRRAVELGARPAEAGEFTFRAMAADRLDLTEVEGISATIAATNDAELAAAHWLREGSLRAGLERLSDGLSHALAMVEAEIDFTDQEDVTAIHRDELYRRISEAVTELDGLLESLVRRRSVPRTPVVVLMGPPSSGKSTLFNALLGRERALTDARPGTTRDVLVEEFDLVAGDGPGAGGTGTLGRTSGRPAMRVQLVDMAGLDEPRLLLDHQVQQQARSMLGRADLVLQVESAAGLAGRGGNAEGGGGGGAFWSPLEVPEGAGCVRVLTMMDLIDGSGTEPKAGAMAWEFEAPGSDIAAVENTEQVRVCAPTGQGLAELRQAILQQLADRRSSVAEGHLALQPRHESALRLAREHLNRLLEDWGEMVPPDGEQGAELWGGSALDQELAAFELRQALDQVGKLTGRITPDDIIGHIFSRFCIGK